MREPPQGPPVAAAGAEGCRMTPLAFLIVSGALPFLPIGIPIGQQARAAVDQGLQVDVLTMQPSVTWEA